MSLLDRARKALLDFVPDDIAEVVRERLDLIYTRSEAYLAAFVGEYGCQPSECELVRTLTPDGDIIRVRRRYPAFGSVGGFAHERVDNCPIPNDHWGSRRSEPGTNRGWFASVRLEDAGQLDVTYVANAATAARVDELIAVLEMVRDGLRRRERGE